VRRYYRFHPTLPAQVICFGGALCVLVVGVLRYRAAVALSQHPMPLLMDVTRKLRDHKVSRADAQSCASIPQSSPATAGAEPQSQQGLDSSF